MADKKVYRASTTAPVNIAVIKYWGKRDPTLNLPTNSSLSVTLSQADLRTHTTASCSASFPPPDTLLLNSFPQSLSTPRSQACLSSLRALRAALEADDPSLPPLSTYPLRLVSTNNFPTAAGLASSAAGFAALVRAIADLYALPHSPEHLSLIARQGSGSACRSLLGGYVAWDAGTRTDGQDSRARLVAPRSHWPDLRALILIASAAQKDVSSTDGMQATVHTSGLFRTRVETLVPERMTTMEAAIHARDFATFARVTMRESNSFHATCLDTEPPIFYLNDISRAAIQAVQAINEQAGRPVAAYTFDAGPNAVVYYERAERDTVLAGFRNALGGKEGWDDDDDDDEKGGQVVGVPVGEKRQVVGVGEKRQRSKDGGQEAWKVTAGGERTAAWVVAAAAAAAAAAADETPYVKLLRSGIKRIIHTSVGDGPVSVQEHLVDEDGEPIITLSL